VDDKVLVIDDDPELFSLLRLELQRKGFTVISATSGTQGLRRAYEMRPDVILLDIMMPDMDGWLTCQRLRNICDTPIIILSARKAHADIVKGLVMGADDYLVKPCSLDELTARMRAVIRRARAGPSGRWRGVFDDDHLRIDLRNGRVTRDGKEIPLTSLESRLFLYLVSQEGRIVPHEELLVNVWGPEYATEVDYLSVYICYLRRKIEEDPSNPRYIHTRWGQGYCFSGDGTVESKADEKMGEAM
jgi:two-component system KDP operon response regulator KdpE